MHPEADILTQPSALRSLKSPKKVGLFFGGGGKAPERPAFMCIKAFRFFERRRKSLKCSTFESPPKPHFFLQNSDREMPSAVFLKLPKTAEKRATRSPKVPLKHHHKRVCWVLWGPRQLPPCLTRGFIWPLDLCVSAGEKGRAWAFCNDLLTTRLDKTCFFRHLGAIVSL